MRDGVEWDGVGVLGGMGRMGRMVWGVDGVGVGWRRDGGKNVGELEGWSLWRVARV